MPKLNRQWRAVCGGLAAALAGNAPEDEPWPTRARIDWQLTTADVSTRLRRPYPVYDA